MSSDDGKSPGGVLLKSLYDSLDQDAAIVAKASVTAVGWGILVASIAAGVWAFGATDGGFLDKLGPFVASALTATLWGGACAAIGAGLGFLFGVPRTGAPLTQAVVSQGAGSTEVNPGLKTAPTTTADPNATATTLVDQKASATAAIDPKAAAATAVDPKATTAVDSAGGQVASGSRGQDSQKVGSKVNTNLEEISDWLTKIIVGVTLVELPRLISKLEKAAAVIAGSLGGDSRISFAYAVLMYFTVTGFLGGYLLTRLYLQKAFQKADN